MAEMDNKLKQIIADLEQNVENKKDLEYIKTQIYNISILFLDELDKLTDSSMQKMDIIMERHQEMNSRLLKIEDAVKSIEKDIYMEDDECDLEITCPYCDAEFEVDLDETNKNEVKCPECNNVIELDWNEEEHHSCSCGDCHCAEGEDKCSDDCDCDDCDCDDLADM